MRLSPQFELPGALPKDRAVLTITECARLWNVTSRHVTGLIEEGELVAIDVSGRRNRVSIPSSALSKLATRAGVTLEQLLEYIQAVTPAASTGNRALWRVPIVEGYGAFMQKRQSLNQS